MSGRITNVRPKPGFVFDGQSVVPAQSNVVPIRDGALANVLTGRGTSVDRQAHNFWRHIAITPDQIDAAYRGNWLHRKIVDIPAQDMTRAGRDWDATDDEISKIEAEEKRLGYWAKLRQAVTLGRLGGGAILIGLGDDPSKPLPATIRPAQIQYLTVFSRWQLALGEMVTDPINPLFGQPSYFQLSGAGTMVRIHPSRVVCFHGLPVPAIAMASSWEDRFWGDSVIQAVDEAVQQTTMASAGFASLIDEAKIDIFRFSRLVEQLSQPGGQDKVMQRVQLTSSGKSIHRAVVLDSEDEWDQRQIAWAGMRDVILTYDGRVAGAADIPATRLFGKAPDGFNATGESDLVNYFQGIAAKQQSDLRPAMEALDAAMLPSAGVKSGLPWSFSPLMVLSEEKQAEIENKEADSVSKIANTGLIPESALAKAVQNRLIESERFPGLQDAIAEAEAAGEGLPEDDPSAIAPVPGKQITTDTRFLDATPRSLYVRRDVVNVADLRAWAKKQGLPELRDDLHVTIIYSREPMDWMKIDGEWNEDAKGQITIPPGGVRIVEPLGDRTAVLLFTSSALSWRHESIVRAGAKHGFDSYQPHISLTGEAVDLANVEPYRGKIVLGPEIFEEVRGSEGEQRRPFVDHNPNHRPGGSRRGGQFAPKGSGSFTKGIDSGVATNAEMIRAQTGVEVGHLTRQARASDLNHASKFSKKGRRPPSQAVLRRYAIHAANATSVRVQGQRGHGSGLRLRSEIAIGARSYTLIERVGERARSLSFVTMWEND